MPRMFHGALCKDGMLVMEHTQKVPQALQPLLEQTVPHAQLYRKMNAPATNVCRWDSGVAERVGLSDDRPLPHRVPHTA